MYPTVEVLAHHKPGRPPEPVRIRMQKEDGTQEVFSVRKIRDLKKERMNGNIMYVWKIEVKQGDVLKEMGIKYERDTMLWYLMI